MADQLNIKLLVASSLYNLTVLLIFFNSIRLFLHITKSLERNIVHTMMKMIKM